MIKYLSFIFLLTSAAGLQAMATDSCLKDNPEANKVYNRILFYVDLEPNAFMEKYPSIVHQYDEYITTVWGTNKGQFQCVLDKIAREQKETIYKVVNSIIKKGPLKTLFIQRQPFSQARLDELVKARNLLDIFKYGAPAHGEKETAAYKNARSSVETLYNEAMTYKSKRVGPSSQQSTILN